jgi:hypothetical protein
MEGLLTFVIGTPAAALSYTFASIGRPHVEAVRNPIFSFNPLMAANVYAQHVLVVAQIAISFLILVAAAPGSIL